jgi:hypothetical protein
MIIAIIATFMLIRSFGEKLGTVTAPPVANALIRCASRPGSIPHGGPEDDHPRRYVRGRLDQRIYPNRLPRRHFLAIANFYIRT